MCCSLTDCVCHHLRSCVSPGTRSRSMRFGKIPRGRIVDRCSARDPPRTALHDAVKVGARCAVSHRQSSWRKSAQSKGGGRTSPAHGEATRISTGQLRGRWRPLAMWQAAVRLQGAAPVSRGHPTSVGIEGCCWRRGIVFTIRLPVSILLHLEDYLNHHDIYWTIVLH